MKMRASITTAIFVALCGSVAGVASAQVDQQEVAGRYDACLKAAQYAGMEITAEQNNYCLQNAIVSVFVDRCMALDTSWLKLGRHAYCVDLAKKQFGY